MFPVAGWNVVGTAGEPPTVDTFAKQSVNDAAPPRPVTTPSPAHGPDDALIAATRLLNPDSARRSNVFATPRAPRNVTPLALPGWNDVGTAVDPSTTATFAKQSVSEGAPPLPPVSSPSPAHGPDDALIAATRLLNPDSAVRSSVFATPAAPRKVTPLARPGWNTVGTVAPFVSCTTTVPIALTA